MCYSVDHSNHRCCGYNYWAAIIPMVSQNIDEESLCLDATSKLSIGGDGYTCYDAVAGGGMLKLQIKNGAGGDVLEDIQVLYTVGGTSTSHMVIDGTTFLSGKETAAAGCGSDLTDADNDLPGENQAKVICFWRATAYADAPDSVSIAPVIEIGSSLKTCNQAATLNNIPACA